MEMYVIRDNPGDGYPPSVIVNPTNACAACCGFFILIVCKLALLPIEVD